MVDLVALSQDDAFKLAGASCLAALTAASATGDNFPMPPSANRFLDTLHAWLVEIGDPRASERSLTEIISACADFCEALAEAVP